MPANQRQQTAKSRSPIQVPTSPASKPTAKYTNKDGSKFITVPKSESTETTATNMASPTAAVQNREIPSAPAAIPNKKKQKRREKLAAKRAAEQDPRSLSNGAHHAGDAQGTASSSRHTSSGQIENGQFDSPEGDPYYSEEEGDVYSGSYGSPPNGHSNTQTSNAQGTSGSQRKKKGKNGHSRSPDITQPSTNGMYHNHAHNHGHAHNHPGPLLSSLQTSMPRGPGISKEKIWNTSSQEERERIKEFWLSLEEGERKSLVKVEKDAVLKKMKEQQRHSCSCTVCGRKRTAIEEELEVLYDAYYEELEQYANHHDGVNQPMMPPPRRFGPMSGLQPPNRLPPSFAGQHPSRGRIVEPPADDEDEEGDDDYSEDPLDEDYESEPEEIPPRSYQTDFFNFGASLTVQGGILTVADDLLKNDGKKFIEMMEQLAERRMAREEDARDQGYYGHPPNGMHTHSHTHNHPPPPVEEEEYDDDEEDDEYDSQDEDYDDDEEELDTMTEEQRMEEGRRMFQIFAARMFEQRVLTAYREKVAKERQQKLIEEDEEERKRDDQRKAKKAKDAQKKKDKLQQKKQLIAEEKAKKEAEDAERLAAKAAEEEKAREDQRIKDEEKRKKREAQKAAQDAERHKQLLEKQRAKDRQMEEERKKREAKEKKDEQKREERERKEREASERKAKVEQEKRDKDAKLKAEKETRDRQQRDELAAQHSAAKAAAAAAAAFQAIKRPPVPIPVNIQPPIAAIASPHIPIATPVVPKAPTPIRLRTASQQESSGSSVPQTPQTGGLSQNVSPVPSTPLQGSPGPIGPPNKSLHQQPFLHQPQASSPIHSALKTPPGMQPNQFAGIQPLNMGFQPNMPQMMPPGFSASRIPFDPMFPQMGGQYRPMGGPNIPVPPGINMHQMHQGRGFPMQNVPPGFPQSPSGFGGIGQAFGAQKDSMPPQSHSRQPSGSFDPMPPAQAQPIARPAPIGRPASVVHGQRHGENIRNEVDDLSNALGSSALIDDSDEPLGAGPRRSSGALGGMNRQFPPPSQPFGMESSAFGGSPITPWGAPSNPFGASSLPGSNYAGGWPQSTNTSFGTLGTLGNSSMRASQPRSVSVRLMICRACKELEGSTPDGFFDVGEIKSQIGHAHAPLDPPVSEKELIDICGTEGTPSNGGGYLDIGYDGNGHARIRYDSSPSQRLDSAGHIGSPIVGGGRF